MRYEQETEGPTLDGLRVALSEMWDTRAADTVVVKRGGEYSVSSRANAETLGEQIVCDAADDGSWGVTPLEEYEDGDDFAAMAMACFGEDLMRAQACDEYEEVEP